MVIALLLIISFSLKNPVTGNVISKFTGNVVASPDPSYDAVATSMGLSPGDLSSSDTISSALDKAGAVNPSYVMRATEKLLMAGFFDMSVPLPLDNQVFLDAIAVESTAEEPVTKEPAYSNLLTELETITQKKFTNTKLQGEHSVVDLGRDEEETSQRTWTYQPKQEEETPAAEEGERVYLGPTDTYSLGEEEGFFSRLKRFIRNIFSIG